ncbi:MAG: class I SAM-dependent methyltransferase, partial [Candidatus Dadabacteria bacterium]
MRQYNFNEDTLYWEPDRKRGGKNRVTFSDGFDTEHYLRDLFLRAKDLSSKSLELTQAIKDWPTRYHLSPQRGFLLYPFPLSGRSVLEIGSGCGAITRYLADIGSNVTAIEGNPLRAQITALRCKDKSNVSVYCDNIFEFESDKTFEVVTLIGVLEYAPCFSASSNPVIELLQRSLSLLSPNGVLIVAIENRLGLKYFCGHPED